MTFREAINHAFAAAEMLAILQVLVARHPKDCACLGGCDFRIARALLAKIEE